MMLIQYFLLEKDVIREFLCGVLETIQTAMGVITKCYQEKDKKDKNTDQYPSFGGHPMRLWDRKTIVFFSFPAKVFKS